MRSNGSEYDDFPRPSKPKAHLVMSKSGEKIPDVVVEKIKQMLASGTMSIAEVARNCMVSPNTVSRYLNKDEELKSKREREWLKKMEEVEESMVERAISGRNEIAAQRAGEFLLAHNMRERYNDNVVSNDRMASLPKIIVPIAVPVRDQPQEIESSKETIDV